MRFIRLPALVALLCLPLLSGCLFIVVGGPGRIAHFNAVVRFQNQDGSPAGGRPYYILETFEHTQKITEASTTGADGVVRITGVRCPPVTVAASGGAGTLDEKDVSTAVTVTLSNKEFPDLVATYGQFNPKAVIKRVASFGDCIL